jgi:hypothetical protein
MRPVTQITSTVAVVGSLLVSGCSAFRPIHQTVNIVAFPEDATLVVNGKKYQPPAQISVMRDQEVAIQCFKEGYAPYNHTIGTHMNGIGALDVVGTVFFLFPVLGLFAPGAHSLDQTDVNITLYERGHEPPPCPPATDVPTTAFPARHK